MEGLLILAMFAWGALLMIGERVWHDIESSRKDRQRAAQAKIEDERRAKEVEELMAKNAGKLIMKCVSCGKKKKVKKGTFTASGWKCFKCLEWEKLMNVINPFSF